MRVGKSVGKFFFLQINCFSSDLSLAPVLEVRSASDAWLWLCKCWIITCANYCQRLVLILRRCNDPFFNNRLNYGFFLQAPLFPKEFWFSTYNWHRHENRLIVRNFIFPKRYSNTYFHLQVPSFILSWKIDPKWRFFIISWCWSFCLTHYTRTGITIFRWYRLQAVDWLLVKQLWTRWNLMLISITTPFTTILAFWKFFKLKTDIYFSHIQMLTMWNTD